MEKNGLLLSLRGRRPVSFSLVYLSVAMLSGCIETGVVSVKPSQAAAGSELAGEIDAIVAGDAIVASDETVSDVAESDAETAIDGVETLRIMAVGDSITHGVAGAKSYRQPLIDMLEASGCDFEMVGSMTTNLPDTGFESPHEAYSGHRTDAFLTGRQSSFGNNEGISVSMMQFQPQLILLKIGTNDVSQNRDINDTVANVDQIVALIFDAEPESRVVVSTLVPYFKSTDPDDSVNVGLETFSEALKAWYIQASHPRVHLVDIREGFTADMLLPDLIHPGDTGDAFIANRFFQSFEENDFCG